MEETNVCSNNGDRRHRLRAILAGLGYAALFFVMQAVVSFTIAIVLLLPTIWASIQSANPALIYEAYANIAIERAALITAGADVITLVTIAAIHLARHENPLALSGLSDAPNRSLWLLLPLGLLLNAAVSVGFAFLPADWVESYAQAAEQTAAGTDFFSIFAVAVIVPICEETVFRGFAYGRFQKAMPKYAAAILQALLFGLMHGHPLWMAYAFIMGLVFAFVREKYGSLRAPILLHMAFNGASYLFLLPAKIEDIELVINAIKVVID